MRSSNVPWRQTHKFFIEKRFASDEDDIRTLHPVYLFLRNIRILVTEKMLIAFSHAVA